MNFGSLSKKMRMRACLVYTWPHLKSLDHCASVYSFGIVFDGIFEFCISFFALEMMSSLAYVIRRWFMISFQEDCRPSGWFKNFSFVKYRRDTNEAAAGLVAEYFPDHIAAPT